MADIAVAATSLSELLAQDEAGILAEWIQDVRTSAGGAGFISDADLRGQCADFLHLFRDGLNGQSAANAKDPRWKALREMLAGISKSRAVQGFSPTETATFVLSFKRPLFRRLKEHVPDPELFAQQVWNTSELVDALALYTTDVFLQTKEELIRRAQEDMLELSTPVVKLWDGILALPLIGTLDSARTQVVMETLLEAIVATNSKVAIIDITGVATVDTVVAQHLLKTVTAARLMGADCIISGIRPQIAQTIVHLGINLMDVASKATLRDAFALALEKTGQRVHGGDVN